MRYFIAACLQISLVALLNGFSFAQGPGIDIGFKEIRLEVFVRSDRDSAETAQAYVTELGRETKGLDIQIYDVLKDKTALIRLYELSKRAGRDKPVLPAFHTCDRMYFGFSGSDRSGPAIEQLFTANLYTRSTCPRCQKLKAFLPTLKRRWPAIRFVIHDVDRSTSALSKWHELCRAAGSPPGLPTIEFARRIMIGYQGDDVTGAQLDRLIDQVSGREVPKGTGMHRPVSGASGMANQGHGHLHAYATVLPISLLMAPLAPDDAPPIDLLELPDEADQTEVGEIAPTVETVTTDTIDVPLLGKLSASEMGMPLFTLAIGLVDGFNPCAMWVLVFLLSVLVNIKDRRKIFAIAGTFIVISGAAYFAFMAVWLNVSMLIGLARPVQIALGILAVVIGTINVKDFYAFKKGITLSIPESQKPRLYRRVREIVNQKYLPAALASAVALAIIVNTIELLCTAGLPALYAQVLTMQDYPIWKNYSYLFLYIIAYMLDDTVLLAIVVTTLSHRRLQEREGRWLKLLSGLVILILGLIMLLRPEWLTFGS